MRNIIAITVIAAVLATTTAASAQNSWSRDQYTGPGGGAYTGPGGGAYTGPGGGAYTGPSAHPYRSNSPFGR